MKCNKDLMFVITYNSYIEIRNKKDEKQLASICCEECLPELEKIIKKFKKMLKKK